jgi:hypothetical protein
MMVIELRELKYCATAPSSAVHGLFESQVKCKGDLDDFGAGFPILFYTACFLLTAQRHS